MFVNEGRKMCGYQWSIEEFPGSTYCSLDPHHEGTVHRDYKGREFDTRQVKR
jgi:hypothetical protein